MKLTHIADKVAADIYRQPIDPDKRTADAVRDACGGYTAGDLSMSMLDKLCDMVERRLNGPRFWRWRLEQMRQ